MNQESKLYYERRERAERAAAKSAANAEARRVHQQLASHYAALAQQPANGTSQLEEGAGPSNVIVLQM